MATTNLPMGTLQQCENRKKRDLFFLIENIQTLTWKYKMVYIIVHSIHGSVWLDSAEQDAVHLGGLLYYYFSRKVKEYEDAEETQSNKVKLKSGSVRGIFDHDAVVFKGIPYAVAPEGDLSWKAPVACDMNNCWTGTFEASEFGTMCVQQDVHFVTLPFVKATAMLREVCLAYLLLASVIQVYKASWLSWTFTTCSRFSRGD